MADKLNPFEEDELIETQIDSTYFESPDASHSDDVPDTIGPTDISWDAIALKLLKDNHLLTALELHTELVESGRELPRLRDYFSNPGNFERIKEESPSPTLPRAPSVQTFDSLDFARYSDDGERQVDERVAVLEFELRKAQDTIKHLRATLTKEAENDLVSPDSSESVGMADSHAENIKPLEHKALNFLVNEYLLINNYKLTSVTFAEENEEQDFEDWDDVGLNIPRPPGLLHLFRDYGNHIMPQKESQDVGCEADIEDEHHFEMQQDWMHIKEQLESKVYELEDQLQIIGQENEVLSKQVQILKINPRNAHVVHSTSKSHKPKRSASDNLSEVKDISSNNLVEQSIENDWGAFHEHSKPVDELGHETSIADSNDVSPLINSKAEERTNAAELNTDVLDAAGGGGVGENTEQDQTIINSPACERKLSESFKSALQEVAFHISTNNRIVTEVSKSGHSDIEGLVLMLGRCLPHIVPNVLLAKREELIPLILCTAMLHPDSQERDHLLNILFNLIKKPDEEQRQMILTGCIAFAQHVGQTRLEAELLPQCWEQISHKYVERRLLVAEACGALASYLSYELRSSLLLSMLKQMLVDDKDEEVREAVVRSLGFLTGWICDADKFSEIYDLLRLALRDSSEKVVSSALHVFLPSFAAWAYELGHLEHQLTHSILRELEEMGALAVQKTTNSTTLPLDEGRFLLLLAQLQELIPFLFLSVLENGPYTSHLDLEDSKTPVFDLLQFPESTSLLSDLRVIVGDDRHLLALINKFEEHIGQEWVEPWEQYNWIINNLIARLLEVTMGVGLSLQKIVSSLCKYVFRVCRTFGRTFTNIKVKPKFEALVMLPEEEPDSEVNNGHTALTTCVVPVYAAGVLISFNMEDDRKRLAEFLQQVLCTLAFCQAPLDSLKAAFSELCLDAANHELLLNVLWIGVVHPSGHVRATAACMFELMIKHLGDNLISTRVVPALVTLANDPEISVRLSTIPSLGAIIEQITIREVLDRVYMQLQTFFDDPLYRDQHSIHVELIRTMARVGPNSEPRFRDEFILPRLAAMALANNHTTNETKKMDITLQLFEAYSAMSCCFINDQLIQEAMLPGLRCLQQDMAVIAPEHEEVVASMVREYECKIEGTRPADRSSSFTSTLSSQFAPGSEDMKSRVMSRIKDTTSKANLSNIFTRKK
ncbi:RAB11-binding protein RELCH homolog [Gigantopelta aegis]|uniref:RAB11-binding protein RELCH homolog n=1 Tax=Gigantopelta aegis TaxID=1735272 RepID=UPI001B88A58D|nr:RAB11-binding protein RELCH homolog [Gigantopelta aegis]